MSQYNDTAHFQAFLGDEEFNNPLNTHKNFEVFVLGFLIVHRIRLNVTVCSGSGLIYFKSATLWTLVDG